jgi:hypothetical protein
MTVYHTLQGRSTEANRAKDWKSLAEVEKHPFDKPFDKLRTGLRAGLRRLDQGPEGPSQPFDKLRTPLQTASIRRPSPAPA